MTGMILGTAGYMSPEQARGQEVDKRADIWAFGVVLYEMVTGKRLFDGPTVSDSLAAILKEEPDLTLAPQKTRRLLRRCLEKDPHKRLRDIGDWAELLEEVPAAHGTRDFSRVPWAIAATAIAAALALGYIAWRHYTEDAPRVQRLSILTPEHANFNAAQAIPAISPDGRHVAFAQNINGQVALWLRDLDGLSARALLRVSGASYPFWSPDSRWIGFFAGGKLNKIDITGDPPLEVCDAPNARGGAWNQDGVIVFALLRAGMFRVSAGGGTPTMIDSAAGGIVDRLPWFLPDGRHFLYTANNGADSGKARVYMDSVDAKPGLDSRKEVLTAASNAVYVPPLRSSPGYILFAREQSLMAQPFDPVTGKTNGDAVAVAEQVVYSGEFSQGQFSVSQNGILVYASGAAAQNKQLTWFDRGGKSEGTVGASADTLSVSLSPDGTMVATDAMDSSGLRDIWLHNLARGTLSRFTFGPKTNESPVWSPDGSRIAFYSFRDGNPYVKATVGAGTEEVLDKIAANTRIDDWSQDGRWLVENRVEPKTANNIWVLPQFGDRKPFVFLNSEFHEGHARLSPGVRWLAYVSDESKRYEVYVESFPEHRGKWQISTGGGDFPVWSRDGRELYFIAADRKMTAVDVKGTDTGFQAGVPKPLFEVATSIQFDVSRDGRFLIQVPVATQAASVPLTVVTNWQAGLKK